MKNYLQEIVIRTYLVLTSNLVFCGSRNNDFETQFLFEVKNSFICKMPWNLYAALVACWENLLSLVYHYFLLRLKQG